MIQLDPLSVGCVLTTIIVCEQVRLSMLTKLGEVPAGDATSQRSVCLH